MERHGASLSYFLALASAHVVAAISRETYFLWLSISVWLFLLGMFWGEVSCNRESKYVSISYQVPHRIIIEADMVP
jgi:hypothetical protein